MFKVAIPLILCSGLVLAKARLSADIPDATFKRLKTIYPEQSDAFLRDRLQNARTPFKRWRSFPPYYFDLMERKKNFLGREFNKRKGLCAGDPHISNFGFLYLSGQSAFVLNDLDDVAPCPLNADILRLFIGHRMLAIVNTKVWLEAYKTGLSGKNIPMPKVIQELEKESLEGSSKMYNVYKKLLQARSCTDVFVPLSAPEIEALKSYLVKEGKKFVMGCSRTKTSGGSAGKKRYIPFYETTNGIEVVELKSMATPAPLVRKSMSNLKREKLLIEAIKTYLGPKYHEVYYPVTISNVLYLRRPLWSGNLEVSEDDHDGFEIQEIINYEAWALGHFHSLTNKKDAFDYASEKWEAIALEIEKQWQAEFGQ